MIMRYPRIAKRHVIALAIRTEVTVLYRFCISVSVFVCPTVVTLPVVTGFVVVSVFVSSGVVSGL